MVIKKTALMLDHELLAQTKALLGTTTATETLAEAMREVIRVRGRARHFERLQQRAADLTDAEVMGDVWRNGGRRLGAFGDGCGDAPR